MSQVFIDQASLWKYKNLSRERLKDNATLVFSRLVELGVKRIIVNYEGSGDDGGIEEMASFNSLETEGSKEIKPPKEVNELVENFFYDVLEMRCSGWEINEGSFGHFVLTFGPNGWADFKLKHEHNINVMTTEEHQLEGLEDLLNAPLSTR